MMYACMTCSDKMSLALYMQGNAISLVYVIQIYENYEFLLTGIVFVSHSISWSDSGGGGVQ